MVRPNTAVPAIPLKYLVFQTAISFGGDSPSPHLDHIPPGPREMRLTSSISFGAVRVE